MAAKKKGGLINRILMGSEKSEGYARASLPSNRWELFWDIFKGRFWKLVVINLLVLLFCLPAIALFYFKSIAVSGYGAMYPFSQGFGVGYQAPVVMNGLAENVVFNVNLSIYLLLPIVALIAAVGISGGAYVIRNMVWTEGIFVANDFWRGVKQNFKQIAVIALLYSMVFYLSSASIAMCNQSIAMDADYKWLFYVSQVITYTLMCLYTVMTLHMITMSVTYELKLKSLIKNSFLFTIGLLPQNVFFIFLGMLPFLIASFGSIFTMIGIVTVILFAFAMFLLIWTDYCQWAYDKFINDKVPGAQKNRGIYEKVKESNSEALKKYREQVALTSKSSLNSRPIKPITDDDLKIEELPASFNRSDIIKLNESKQRLIDDYARYIEEHKNDPEFLETELSDDEKKRAAETEKKIEAAKKELAKRMKEEK